MIIYHSREALTARLAALLHVGRLRPAATPAEAWALVEPAHAYRAAGLWRAGVDREGRPVCAVGRASRADVTERAFHGLARLFGIAPDRYRLIGVGPDLAWGDPLLIGLRLAGLTPLARPFEIRLLQRRWATCQRAVAEASAGKSWRP